MRDAERLLTEWLEDIVLWGEKLGRHIAGMEFLDFVADEKTADASAKCIEAIGEASSRILQIQPDIQERFPHLSLRDAYRARNRLAHGYFTMDPQLVWKTAAMSVPALVEAAREALRRLQNSETSDE